MPMVTPRGVFGPLALLLALSFISAAASAQTRDLAGAKDFPGIGRFAGSVVTGYQMKDFDAARMQAAPFKDDKPADARRLEGRVTRIAYRTAPGPSILEVSRNFETQLAKAGFETLLACDTGRLRRYSVRRGRRFAAGAANVCRRFQLSLFRGP
jgi:OmpA-OmpF porin, OOP family